MGSFFAELAACERTVLKDKYYELDISIRKDYENKNI